MLSSAIRVYSQTNISIFRPDREEFRSINLSTGLSETHRPADLKSYSRTKTITTKTGVIRTKVGEDSFVKDVSIDLPDEGELCEWRVKKAEDLT
jgi:hypothetical protein